MPDGLLSLRCVVYGCRQDAAPDSTRCDFHRSELARATARDASGELFPDLPRVAPPLRVGQSGDLFTGGTNQ